jgi:transketolase
MSRFLKNVAAEDASVFLLVGDVGFSVFEDFREQFPTRFINAGIAEQNMIGVAAGIAMAGKRVYVYSIIPFVTMRCFEQIRIDLCYQTLPVTLVGVGGGFTYAPMGVTHQALEDIALMRCLPGMTVVAPANKYETEKLMPAIHALQGPCYLRLAAGQEPSWYPENVSVALGKAVELVSHPSRVLVVAGGALDMGVLVFEKLKHLGINIGLVSLPTIKPLDEEYFISKPWEAIFTLEEHFVMGGVGESISRVIAEKCSQKIIFKAFGVSDCYIHQKGSRAYIASQSGLDVDQIVHAIHTLLSNSESL